MLSGYVRTAIGFVRLSVSCSKPGSCLERDSFYQSHLLSIRTTQDRQIMNEIRTIPFLSWRFQSFRHKSTLSPIMHNTKSKKHLSINIIFNSCVQCSEITDLCLIAESVYSRFFQTRLCRQEFVRFPDDRMQDIL